MMTKAMISQPMAGETDEQIAATREKATASLEAMGYEVVLDGDGSRWVREGETPCPSWAEGIPAPVDADGEVVPLMTRVMYGRRGDACVIDMFSFDMGTKSWIAYFERRGSSDSTEVSNLRLRRPDGKGSPQPDSWERLEADVESMSHKENVCCYFGHGNDISCDVCPAIDIDKYCPAAVARDILRRAKAIAWVVE